MVHCRGALLFCPIDTVAEQKKPTMYPGSFFTDAGGLISIQWYNAQYRKLSSSRGYILRGTKPADMPVEQPTEFELVVNMKTGKELGIAIAQPMLLHADRII
jgi:putative tryptophan/tyrosine transport system substrate-binding protein